MIELLEMKHPVISAAAMELVGTAVEPLIAASLLVSDGHEAIATSAAGHDDMPLPVIQLLDGSHGVFDPAHGLVAIGPDRLVMYRLDLPAVVGAMTATLKFTIRQRPHEIVPGTIWDLGSVRLLRSAVHSLWLVQRSDRPDVRHALIREVEARPAERLRIIVTSSRPSGFVEGPTGTIIVSLEDVLLAPDDLALSPEFLGGRVRKSEEGPASNRLHLTPDRTALLRGSETVIQLRSEDRKAAIRALLAASVAGRWTKATDISNDGSLRRFFGPDNWAKLKPLLERGPTGWRFRL